MSRNLLFMPLDNYTSCTLRTCSIEVFTNYVNQETDLNKLTLLGGHIILDYQRSRTSRVPFILQQLEIVNLPTENEQIIKLNIIARRRQQLEYIHE